MGARKIAYINCKMLKWARSQSPIKLEDIPIRTKNISVDQVMAWENGTEYPSITEAKKLAGLYDVPFASLYLTEIPHRENLTYIDRRTYKDNLEIEISYELWKEINRLRSCRENAIEYLEINENKNILKDINVNSNINDIATSIRKIFNIGTPFKNKSSYKNQGFNFFRNIIEKKGIMVLQIEGISIKEIRGISLNYEVLPIIAVNKNDADRAKVFTLFHELSHLIRKTSNLCLIDFNDKADKEEKLCNSLAANILIPKETIEDNIKDLSLKEDREIEKLADKYAVSKFVIIKRLFDLKKIDFELYKNKYDTYLNNFNEIKEKRKNARKKVIVPQDKKLISSCGKLYPKIILDAYYDGKISFGEVCNIFNVNAPYIDSIERMVMFSE